MGKNASTEEEIALEIDKPEIKIEDMGLYRLASLDIFQMLKNRPDLTI